MLGVLEQVVFRVLLGLVEVRGRMVHQGQVAVQAQVGLQALQGYRGVLVETGHMVLPVAVEVAGRQVVREQVVFRGWTAPSSGRRAHLVPVVLLA